MSRAPMTILRTALVAAAVGMLPSLCVTLGGYVRADGDAPGEALTAVPPSGGASGPTAAPPSNTGTEKAPAPSSPPSAPAPGDDESLRNPRSRPAPDFALPDLRGVLVDSSYPSRPVTVVHFWASWCVPCMQEIPELNRLAQLYEPSGAALYAVAIGSGSAGDLRQVEKSFRIHHRVLVGDDHIAGAFGGVASFPVTFLVDNRGWIVEKHEGATRENHRRIEETIRGLLAASGRTVPPKR